MQKIPQAVAMVLLVSALAAAETQTSVQSQPEKKKEATAAAQDAKPTGGKAVGKSISTPVRAQTEITALLKEFLSKVSSSEMHARFWADDLIYTSAKGVVRHKDEIVK